MRANIFSGLLLSISVLAVTACSGGGQGVETHKTAAPTPPANVMENSLTEADTLTPDAGSYAITTSAPLALSAPHAPVNASDSAALENRLAMLEQTMGSLRRDYDRIMPAFASLNTTNERIQTLLDEIEQQNIGAVAGQKPVSATSKTTNAPAMALAPMTTGQDVTTTTIIRHEDDTVSVLPAPGSVSRASAPAISTPKTTIVETTIERKTEDVIPSGDVIAAMDNMAPSSAPVETTNAAKGLRVGEHANKTRLVIDLAGNAKPETTYDLDNTEKLLVIGLPGTAWGGVKSGSPKASAYIAGWNVQENAQSGTNLAIQLKKGAKILSTEYLKAQGKDSARLVIDLGPAS